MNKKDEVINLFRSEFGSVANKFEIMDLLSNGIPMEDHSIRSLKLPSVDYNIVWHPGVYVFIGNNEVYRVGVSVRNSRARVLAHLNGSTQKNGFSVWDIDKFPDKSILLFNIKNKEDNHWLLALECYLEKKLNPKINSGRIG